MKKRTDELRDEWKVKGLQRPEIVAFNAPQLLLGLTEDQKNTEAWENWFTESFGPAWIYTGFNVLQRWHDFKVKENDDEIAEEFCGDIHGAQRMIASDFGDPLFL